MKIYQLIDPSVPQEMREEARAIAVALRSCGNTVEVFHRLDEEQIAPFKECGLTLHRCHLGGSLDILTPVTVSRGIDKGDAVVIQIFNTSTLLCAVRARQLAPEGARVAIALYSGRSMPDFSRPGRERLASAISLYTFPFDIDSRRFHESMPSIPADRICTVAPSLPPLLPSPPEVTESHTPFTLMFYGSIVPAKGLDRFIAALENLTSGNVKAIIIGTGQGRDVMPLLRRTRASAVDTITEWVGEPQDPEIVISRADAAVFPTVTECDDYRPMLMAMRHGLPIIASARSSAPQIFESDDQFIMTDTDNPAIFTEAIKRLMSDDNLRRRLSDASSRRYTVLSEETDTTRCLESIYLSLLTLDQ